MNLVQFYSHKQKEYEQIKCIVDHVIEGVLVTDKSWNVQYCNEKLEGLLGISQKAIIGSSWDEVLLDLNLESIGLMKDGEAQVWDVNEKSLLVSKRICEQIKDCNIFLFHEGNEIGNLEKYVRGFGQREKYKAGVRFSQLVGMTDEFQMILQMAKDWSEEVTPILLTGEPGVGKKSLAEAIHNEGPFKHGPFVVFDSHLYEEETLSKVLFGTMASSECDGLLEIGSNGGTIFIEHIEKLALSLQTRLLAWLKSKMGKELYSVDSVLRDFQLIASSEEELPFKVNTGRFLSELFYLLQAHTLKLPPLRERINDVENLIRWFIAEANQLLGSEIVGIKSDVLTKLKEFRWPGNIQELRHIIHMLVKHSNPPFITMEIAEPIIADIMYTRTSPNDMDWLVQNRTLGEIEKEVIRYVMELEENNQYRAAKRLGIDRSTLLGN